MVKVRLMEKSVNSHAGKVYVTQYRTVGSTLKTERMTRPSRPKLDGRGPSATLTLIIEVERASAALETAALEASASACEAAVAGAAMEDMLGNERCVSRNGSVTSRVDRY